MILPDNRATRVVALASAALVLFAAVRISFIDGLLRPVTIDGPSMAPAFCGVHYDVTCGQCGIHFTCDAEHVPASGLAECFNCGFDQIPLENLPVQPPDHVLLDRWPLLFRAPKRQEVVACRDPDRSLSVKRVVALPGEHLSIAQAQLYDGQRLIRKTWTEAQAVCLLAKVQPEERTELYWAPEASDYDAYNQGELRRPLNLGRDQWLEFDFEVRSKGRVIMAYTDGPAWMNWLVEPGERVALLKLQADDQEWLVSRDLPFDFRRPTRVAFGSFDSQHLLAIDGRVLCQWTNPHPDDKAAKRGSVFSIQGKGLKLRISQCRLWRDIYYLDPDGLSRPWQAPAPLADDEYALLGDNQPVSVDSRHWEPTGVKRRDILGVVYRPFWSRRR